MTNRVHPMALALTATLGAAAFAALPAGSPPVAASTPTDLAQWWEADSVSAAITTVRLLVVVGCGYVAAVATLCALADVLRLRWLRSLALAAASPALRRRLTAGVLITTMAASTTPAHAQSARADAPVVLVDVGPAVVDDSPPDPLVLTDLGPADTVAPTPSREVNPSGPPDPTDLRRDSPAPTTWIVEPGDHLWAIARRTLVTHGLPIDDASVTTYWRELITANTSLLGDDPDLIHPGQVVRLPAPGQG